MATCGERGSGRGGERERVAAMVMRGRQDDGEEGNDDGEECFIPFVNQLVYVMMLVFLLFSTFTPVYFHLCLF